MYVSGALGLNDHRFSNVGDAAGYSLGVGYRPEQGGFGGEIGYLNAGSATISGLGNLEMLGSSVSAVYWIQNDFPEMERLSGNVKLGIYSMTATVVPATATSTGYRFGMGFEYKANRTLGYYADVDGYNLVDATNNNTDNLTVWTIGVRYHF